jgi:hypothetical protein
MTVAWIWLIVIAFKNDAIIWGVVMILFPPACLLFGILRWSVASVPFILFIISIALMFTLSPADLEQFSNQ